MTDREIDNLFKYHPPKGDQEERYKALRGCAKDMAKSMNTHCPPSFELGLAITRLREAVMFANASIAIHEKDGGVI